MRVDRPDDPRGRQVAAARGPPELVDRSRRATFDGGVAVACVESSWRWRAVREDLLGEPRLVAAALVGLVMLAGGIAVESAALGTVGIIGAALITASLVLPIVTKLTVGTVAFERAPTSRDDALAALADEVGPTLHDVARWLSAADDDSVARWVRQALAVAYRDCGLVPRDQRDHHALCVLVRLVRGKTGMAQITRGPDRHPASGAIRPEDLGGIPFDDRAAFVLRRMVLLDDLTGARVLHITPEAFAARAEQAAARLAERGVEPA